MHRFSACCLFKSKTIESGRNNSTYDLELLAIFTDMRYSRHHLLGIHVILRSDCQHLQFLKAAKDPWKRRARWLVNLQQYNFTVEHVKGTELALWCSGQPTPVVSAPASRNLDPIKFKLFLPAQMKDIDISSYHQIHSAGPGTSLDPQHLMAFTHESAVCPQTNCYAAKIQ